MRRLLAILLLLAPTSALADSGMLLGGVANRQMALDPMGTVTRAYGLRRLLTSYTGNILTLRRASDSATLAIGAEPSGTIDTAAAATFCNATTCFVTSWNDQSGNAGDLVQAITGSQPPFAFNCLGALPCVSQTSSAHGMSSSGNVTPATGLVTMGVVANRAVGTAGCILFKENNANRIVTVNAAATWAFAGGTSGSIQPAVTNAAWHAAVGVMTGDSSSVFSIDGVETTGTVTGNTVAGVVNISGVASTTCNTLEAVAFDNLAISAAGRAYLIANQRIWGRF